MRVKQDLPRTFGETFFHHEVDHTFAMARTRLLSYPLSHLHMFKESLPPPLTPFIIAFESLRKRLYLGYTSRNRDGTRADIASYPSIIGETFGKFFATVEKTRQRWQSVELIVEREDRGLQKSSAKSETGETVAPILRNAYHERVSRKRKNEMTDDAQQRPRRARRIGGPGSQG
ncbi:other/FunK1 protein kinase [Coprinopsis cinerea okayama7|uniref:Other/FunK1 protein kinase n=1 Tax=Coprinopsis cinerea (strain Okayama-7 / 130 / ATCC MYA-4618 / FGSC 9003) TaxID=240176 RepID=A8NW32_COPC7|nr:other/FunK1 protein kinase [Coprinopsis cinerea okayama7\|eukprot:XP_001836815.2 other/FunK1 protein kinase [Coprinopsis cinerea okayama7\